MSRLLIPGLDLRTAIRAGAASIAELDALGADPALVFAAKTERSTHLRASVKASQAVEGEPRTRRYVFSDERVDRHGDVILANKWDVKSFAEVEGPILWGHNHGAPPIGKSKKPTVKNVDGMRSLVGDVTFAEDEINPEAGLIWRMVEAGFLKTGSVGFSPFAARYGDELTDKEREKYGLGKWGVLYEGQELLEFSIVSVPANPGAREIERGLKMLTETGVATDAQIDRLIKLYPLTAKQAEERVREAVSSFFLFSPEAMGAIKALADAEADETLDEDGEGDGGDNAALDPLDSAKQADADVSRKKSEDLTNPASIQKDGSADLADAVSKLLTATALLVDAVTLNTESATETAKATRQLADAATNQLERSSMIAGERSTSGAALEDNGDGGKSGEPGDPVADQLAQVAAALKGLTAKAPAAPK